MRIMGMVFTGILLTFGILAIVFGLNMAAFQQYSFFAPKVEQVRNNTFKESQAYNEGMLRQLYDIQRQYLHATPEERGALKAFTLHQFEVYDRSRLPDDLQTFYNNLTVGVQ